MNGRAAKDIGENYEYVKTIAESRLGLLKLDAIEKISLAFTLMLTAISLILFFVVFLIMAVLFLGIWIYKAWDSLLLAALSSTGFFILSGFGVFILREYLFYRPLTNALFKAFYDDE